MKIGLSNIYSFRPHVEQLYYLATLLREAGHELYFLTCDASVGHCYPRQLKGKGKLTECTKCIVGGVRSFPVRNITSISSATESLLANSVLDKLVLSSACTLHRTETDDECNEPDVLATRQLLYQPINTVYQNTRRWIEKNKLEGVICFNGRFELTRAVTYACEQSGIPFVTHERTWFGGHGLHLIPNENCLSLKAVIEMVESFQDKPLTAAQASWAGKLAGERFLQRNSLDWRLYNKNPEPAPWPLAAKGSRVLILPSSKNEFAGHPEWVSGWQDNTQALDDFFTAFSIKPEQVVLRCHPNWAENIGKVGGHRALALYRHWTQQRGVYFISAEQKASTYDLIQQADLVVLNGGSSAVEAGVCGKQVICLGPAMYHKSGFVRVFNDRQSLYNSDAQQPINPETVIRKTLRFLYVAANRFPQFVDYVRAIETTRYQYFAGADANRIINMLRTGKVVPDDAGYAENTKAEDGVIQQLQMKNWSALADYQLPNKTQPILDIGRRYVLRWVDTVRAQFSPGDRA